MCGCLGFTPVLQKVHVACLAELLQRAEQHGSRVADALTKCEVGVLKGQVTLASGSTCANDHAPTLKTISTSRLHAEQSIMKRCSVDVMRAVYGIDGTTSSTTYVDSLLRKAEADAASSIGLVVRPAVPTP